jgi:single-stranded-DNA-specific exonuclease
MTACGGSSATRQVVFTIRAGCRTRRRSRRESPRPATAATQSWCSADFDADGITGLAILTLALRRLGIRVIPYVPSRLDEGHGLSRAAVEAASAAGAQVIVTVDTGSSSVDEVALANAAGIDVLITDHHRVPAVLPAALAIVNPHRADATYPDRRLAGSGVAFTLARLLIGDVALAFRGPRRHRHRGGSRSRARREPGDRPARAGATSLGAAAGPGSALKAAGIAPAELDLEKLAFGIAPRLNAAGRVGEAFDAASLLLADDPAEAERLAGVLDAANLARRDLMKTAVAEARTSPDAVDDAAATVVRGPWPVGIVGLVASRLADERRRPAIVGAELGSVIRASCRSGGELHLADTPRPACIDLLLRHGGHAEPRASRSGARTARVPGAVPGACRRRAPPDPMPDQPIDLAVPRPRRGLRPVPRPAPTGAVRDRQTRSPWWPSSGSR